MVGTTLDNSAVNAGWISYEQFLREAPDGSHVEWVDGKVLPMTPISDAHTNEP